MKDKSILILKIEKAFKDYFDGGLTFTSQSNFCYVVQGTEYAINRFDIPSERVKVKHWYSDIWIYVKIQFQAQREKGKDCILLPFVSISFFQKNGGDVNQMFRAEWDSFIGEATHPQPHWHITSNLALEKALEDLQNPQNEHDEANIFADLFSSEKKDLLNIHSMHFAMAGSWIKDGKMVSSLSNDEQIIDWMKYLFEHVHTEIDYITG